MNNAQGRPKRDHIRRTPPVAAILSLVFAPVAAQASQSDVPLGATEPGKPGEISPASTPSASSTDWRERTRVDLAAFADALRENYIHAVYPDPARWRAWFDHALATVEAGLPLVRDEAGYRALLTDLAAAFQDAHVSVRFESSRPIPTNWPGFLARFDNGTYRITASRQASVTDGGQVSACDDKPISWWISTIARHEVGLPDTLETTRNAAALRLFVDRGSPLRPRPARCTIDGRPVTLGWTLAPSMEIEPIVRSLRGWRPPDVGTRLIGSDGAWVKLGYFQPNDAAQASAFHKAIEAAPSLRDRRFIVLDVRGNGGGPYNWFMAYLRGLYGQAYADHHATARLHIRAVYDLSPAYLKLDDGDRSTANVIAEPADPPYEINNATDGRLQKQLIAAGKRVFRSTPIPIPSGGTVPVNLVRASVYVLTDYGCASACIAFVDELKQFPGVRQIGLPTAVDSRSGTAVEIGLPSKEATARIAAMTRDGRIRDDNEPQLPSIRFTGDIRDDAAVDKWFRDEVLPTDRLVTERRTGAGQP